MDGGEGQKGAQVQKRKEIHCIILFLSEIMIHIKLMSLCRIHPLLLHAIAED